LRRRQIALPDISFTRNQELLMPNGYFQIPTGSNRYSLSRRQRGDIPFAAIMAASFSFFFSKAALCKALHANKGGQP
jgi:hypothetical protein